MATHVRQSIISDYISSILDYTWGLCKKMTPQYMYESSEYDLVKLYMENGDKTYINVFVGNFIIAVTGKYVFTVFHKKENPDDWSSYDVYMYERRLGQPIDRFLFGSKIEINLVDDPSKRLNFNATAVINKTYNYVHTGEVHECFGDCKIRLVKKKNSYVCQKLYDRRFPLKIFNRRITGIDTTYNINECAE